MTKSISFSVPIKPTAKGRPRFSRGRVYTPKRTKDYELIINREAMKHFTTPMQGPLFCEMICIHKTKNKKLIGTWKETRPDADNIFKMVDGLNGIAFNDDGQLAHIVCKKIWGQIDLLKITISEIEENTNQHL
jgi:Holliday junction resolvase RusA-like endonuclease